MRDPNRLDAFYSALCKMHKEAVPDWRFSQLIMNFLAAYGDIFYMEEDRFMNKMSEYLTALMNKD